MVSLRLFGDLYDGLSLRPRETRRSDQKRPGEAKNSPHEIPPPGDNRPWVSRGKQRRRKGFPVKKTCALCLASGLLALSLAACGGGRQNGGTYGNNAQTYNSSGGTYRNDGDSMMENAGDALRNGANDMRNAADRAGDALRDSMDGNWNAENDGTVR